MDRQQVWRVVVRAMALVVAVVGAGVVTAPPAAHAAGMAECDSLSMVALFNRSAGKYTSAEVSRTGNEEAMLRSRSDVVGPWEKFYLCQDGGYTMLLSAERRRLGFGGVVRVELSFPGAQDGMMRATGSDTDGWSTAEQFTMVAVGSEYVSFKSRTANKFAIAETGYAGADDGMLRAASADNSSYRTHFKIVKIPDRTDGLTKPVIFVHGYSVDGRGLNAHGDYWDDYINLMPGTTPVVTWCFYAEDTNCTYEVGHTRSTHIQDLGRMLAAYIYVNYSQRGIAVDIVGHSMGGLVAAAALTGVQKAEYGWPPYLFVEDVVTLSTPFLGPGQLVNLGCTVSTTQCQDMTYNSPFQQWLAPNAQSTSGTDWTLIGFDDDLTVPASSGAPNAYTWAGHRAIYLDGQITPQLNAHRDLLEHAGTGPYAQISCNYYDSCHNSGRGSWLSLPAGRSPGYRVRDAVNSWSTL